MGNNSVPKFIFRLSRFPVYRGSVLGRLYCITIELKNVATTPDNNVIYLGMFQLTSVPVLSVVVVTFLSSIIVLTLNGQLLDCASIAFSERYMQSDCNHLQPLCSWSGYGPAQGRQINVRFTIS